MKKIISFITFLIFITSVQSQTIYFSEDFLGGDMTQWTTIDGDGDGNNWAPANTISMNGDCVNSDSWTSAAGPLTPDNFIVSALPISIPFANNLSLKFKVGTFQINGLFIDDYYSVYLSSLNDTASILSGNLLYSGMLSDVMTADQADGSASSYLHEFDLSAYQGQSLYLTFRHWNSVNENSVLLDDISISSYLAVIDSLDVDICSGLAILNYSGSVGNSYSVDWGDGSPVQIVTSSPVSHTYSSSGNYNVNLYVSDTLNSDTILGSVFIPANACNPDFNIIDNTNCDSIYIAFENTTLINTPVYYDWNIPGLIPGIFNEWNNNVYAYDFTPGTYNVVLYMYSDSAMTNLIDSSMQMFTFTANNSVVADFTYNIISFDCGGAYVEFIDISTNSPVSWEWSFYNSTGQTLFNNQNVFTYLDYGTTSINLTVTDTFGCESSHTLTIPIVGNSLSALIQDSTILQSCDSTTIQFFGNILGANSFTWNVGGQSSSQSNPIFNFENIGGYINVELIISDSLCSDTLISEVFIGPDTCNQNACSYILNLYDSFGDGWNGNSLNVFVNGSLFNSYTFFSGSSQSFPIPVYSGYQISFQWVNNGTYGNECSWTFVNPSGSIILDEMSQLSTNLVGPISTICNDFNVSITSSLDTVINCSSSSYQFTATLSGGTAPYTYVWVYDGNTYTDEFPIITTNPASPNIYLEVTDSNGLVSNGSYLVSSIGVLTLNVSSSTPTCDSSNYLYAYANPSGGSGSYSYLWSNGATTSSINSSTGGITLGSYNVIVTDNVTGCTVSSTVNLYDACYSISGTVYVDYNGNCIVDGADHPLSNSYYVDLTGAGTSWGDWDYVQTSDNGHYFIEDVSVGSYGLDVNGYNVNSYTQACPNASFTVTVDATNPNPSVDIFMTPPAPFQDLSVSLYSITTFTPGFPYWAYGSYCNDGTIPMSGSVVLSYDADLTYITGSSNPDVVDATNNILTWNFTNLQPGQCVSLSPDFTTSTTAVLGSTMSNNIVVNPIAGDVTPTNNTAYVIDTVVGSWDPNDKSVYPFGNITPDQKDHSYHINFQNEGNGPATLVVVRDDLDDNLDIQTLRNVSASHNFVLTIENTDELVFTFNNIYLTPKDDDEPNSKGHIDFTISQKEDLPLGTTIENTAEIFFDFNEAIVTNTVVNTIVEKSTGIETLNALEAIDVYPNPSNGLFNVALENDNSLQSIAVYDVLGKLIFSANDLSGSKAIINLQNTSNGVYIIKVSTEKGTASKRLVLSK